VEQYKITAVLPPPSGKRFILFFSFPLVQVDRASRIVAGRGFNRLRNLGHRQGLPAFHRRPTVTTLTLPKGLPRSQLLHAPLPPATRSIARQPSDPWIDAWILTRLCSHRFLDLLLLQIRPPLPGHHLVRHKLRP
jgi:hypothetical protein